VESGIALPLFFKPTCALAIFFPDSKSFRKQLLHSRIVGEDSNRSPPVFVSHVLHQLAPAVA